MNKRFCLKAIKERSLLDKEKEEILGKLLILRLICLSAFLFCSYLDRYQSTERYISLHNGEKFFAMESIYEN